MPEITVTHIVIIVFAIVIGIVVGWTIRGNRSRQEKAAINAGWQGQLDAQQQEHQRLVDQNKGLMEQISQYQASNRDAKNRAKELSLAVQEAFARRDELQREIKDIRSNLEATLSERDQLQSDLAAKTEEDAAGDKDAKIRKLTRELENWQNRLPPLIERFRARNEEAERLEEELANARERITELEAALQSGFEANETRIEPVRDPDSLTAGRDASNDPEDNEDSDDWEETGERRVVDDEDDKPVDDDLAAAARDDEDDDPDDEDDDFAEDLDDENDDFETTPSANDPSGLHSLRDDLKEIKGVGPAIEKTLNEMGIFRYQQIADMSEYDIDRVAKRLRGFRSRIYREDWIGQARQLLDLAARA